MTANKKNSDPRNRARKGSADPGKRPPAEVKIEIGGQSGPEPTRYGDWEKNGRCSDF